MEYKLTFVDGSNGYLEHFGVKGMHWGVWNDETRARRLGLHSGRRSDSGPFTSSSSNASSKTNRSGLSDKQKKAIKIALGTAAVVAIAGVGLYAAKKTGALDKGRKAVKNLIKKNDVPVPVPSANKVVHPFEENLPKLQHKESMTESVKKANPLFGSWGHGDNCTRCSTALELRARGFDVEATPMESGQHSMAIANAFKNARVRGGMYDSLSDKQYKALSKILSDTSLNETERTNALAKHLLTHPATMIKMNKGAKAQSNFADYVAKCPDGARGNFMGVNKATGGGHSMFWTKENGKLAIYDGQSGEKYHDAAKVLENYSSHHWLRTDNKEINWDVMSKQVRAHNPYYDTLPSSRKYTYQDTGGYISYPSLWGFTEESSSGGYVSEQLARKFARARNV